MEEDEGYISRVLDGREVTTGSWAPRSTLGRVSVGHRRSGSSEYSIEQGVHGSRRRGSKWRSRRERGRQGTTGGAPRNTGQRGPRRAGGSQDGRQRPERRGIDNSRVSGRIRRGGRGAIGEAGMQGRNVSRNRHPCEMPSAMDSGSETLVEILHRTGEDAFSTGTVSFFDPVCGCLEFQSFCVAIKAQILMVYGPGRIYSCCCDVLRNSVMARALRLVVREIEDWKFSGLQVSSGVNSPSHDQITLDQSQSHTLLDDMMQDSANLAALSCICMYFEVPKKLILEFPTELESSGHAGSWFVACVMLLRSIGDGLSKSGVSSLTLRLPARLAKSLSSVVTQGLLHVEQAIRSLIDKSSDIRNICFQIRPMPQIENDPWIHQKALNIVARLSLAIEIKNQVWERSRLAFLMVTHPRLGKESPFNHIPENVLAQVIEEVCASQRISIQCLG